MRISYKYDKAKYQNEFRIKKEAEFPTKSITSIEQKELNERIEKFEQACLDAWNTFPKKGYLK